MLGSCHQGGVSDCSRLAIYRTLSSKHPPLSCAPACMCYTPVLLYGLLGRLSILPMFFSISFIFLYFFNFGRFYALFGYTPSLELCIIKYGDGKR